MTQRTPSKRRPRQEPSAPNLKQRAADLRASMPGRRSKASATPAPDVVSDAGAVLAAASADFRRVEMAIAAIPSVPGQDLDEAPEYAALEAEAEQAVSVLIGTSATDLAGLQAKAKAILSDRLSIQSPEALLMARSLAIDVLASSTAAIAPQAGRRTGPMPEPGSAEAMAAFHAACHEHTVRTQFADEYPDLRRTTLEWWTARSLSAALEAGEITPAECARLYPRATERELRMAQIEHELNLGALHALAFANSYAGGPGDPDEAEPDPVFALIDAHHAAFCTWDTAEAAVGNTHPSEPGLQEARKATIPLLHAEENAFMTLVGSLPASLPGLMALADYLPGALVLRGAHEADDEAALALGAICAGIRSLVAKSKVTAATDSGPTDWYSPPPGFMASPAIEPTHFALIPHALRVELDRLHSIAQREFDRQVRSDTAPARRERLRRLLKLDIFEAASLSGDAEILTLGVELDAAHTRWRASLPAHNAAQARFSWAEQDAKEQGKDVWAAHEAVWNEPGVREAMGRFEDICAELDPLCRKIWRTPARTPLGLAVKARASLVMTFACGEYEAGRNLGEDEDLTEQSARHLIEACCAYAGVDWKGELTDGTTLAAPPVDPTQQVYGLAAKFDFKAASVLELRTIHDGARSLSSVAYDMSCKGACQSGDRNPLADHHNAVGRFLHWLGDALTDVESRAADELHGRQPASIGDQRARLGAIAERIIFNGDDDETARFLRELAAFAAEQARS